MPAAAVAAAATLGGATEGVATAIQRKLDDGSPTSATTTTAVVASSSSGQSLRSRILAAAGASFVSVVVVNPFDVVKTRMQAASAIRSPAFSTGGRADGVSSSSGASLGSRPTTPSSSSATSVLRSVLRREGWRGLWRGADFALLMSLPMVGVYMPLYDDALAALRSLSPLDSSASEGGRDKFRRFVSSDAVAPALAGGAARAVAVLATSPLELARTRAQAPPEWTSVGDPGSGGDGKKPSPPSSSRLLRRRLPAALPQPSGPGVAPAVRAAWTGSAATLARDVPFSALYWALLEPVRSAALRWWPRAATSTASMSSSPPQPPSAAAVAFANLVSGATAGGAAAALTTPFDVVKTKLQLEAGRKSGGSGSGTTSPSSVPSTLRSLYSRGGLRALFAGVGPRSARAAPACAIVVASYELLKMVGGGGGAGGEEGSWQGDERGLALGAESD